MKGLLIALGVTPPATHDLIQLDKQLSQVCPQWSWSVRELRYLSRASVVYRYPGESADRDEAVEALDVAARARQALLPLFP